MVSGHCRMNTSGKTLQAPALEVEGIDTAALAVRIFGDIVWVTFARVKLISKDLWKLRWRRT